MKLISLTFENSKFEGLEINGNFLLGKNIHRTFSVKKWITFGSKINSVNVKKKEKAQTTSGQLNEA